MERTILAAPENGPPKRLHLDGAKRFIAALGREGLVTSTQGYLGNACSKNT
jgi:hypothetical protein